MISDFGVVIGWFAVFANRLMDVDAALWLLINEVSCYNTKLTT
jgi:hypothetical protein